MGKPILGEVQRDGGKPLDAGVPNYLVQSTTYPGLISSLSESTTVVDFGEAFFDMDPPDTLRTPLAVRAPEVLLGDKFDHRADLWSLGCLVCIATFYQ